MSSSESYNTRKGISQTFCEPFICHHSLTWCSANYSAFSAHTRQSYVSYKISTSKVMLLEQQCAIMAGEADFVRRVRVQLQCEHTPSLSPGTERQRPGKRSLLNPSLRLLRSTSERLRSGKTDKHKDIRIKFDSDSYPTYLLNLTCMFG